MPVMQTLDDVLAEAPSKSRRVNMAGVTVGRHDLQSDVEVSLEACVQGRTVFFQVVHALPSSMHTVRVPLGQRLLSDEIALTVHASVDIGSPDACIDCQPVRTGKSAIVILGGLQYSKLV